MPNNFIDEDKDRLEKDECLITNGLRKEVQDELDDAGRRMVKAMEDDYEKNAKDK